MLKHTSLTKRCVKVISLGSRAPKFEMTRHGKIYFAGHFFLQVQTLRKQNPEACSAGGIAKLKKNAFFTTTTLK